MLGLNEFSMHPSQILQVRDRLAALDRTHLRRHAAKLLRAHTHEQVAATLNAILANAAPC
jgi:phosphotransferase system enzyme I (PtsI)